MNNPASDIRFGLLGHGIQGSLSPKLFAAAYGGLWPYDLIDEESWEDAFRRFIDGPYKAVNVTAPFKLEALKAASCAAGSGLGSANGWAVGVDPLAQRIGGANILIKRPGGGLYASNSDYWGVYDTLLSAMGPGSSAAAHIPRFEKAVVIGAGGAARAAVVACEDIFGEVVVVSRSPREGLNVRPLSELAQALKGAAVVVYTLPCALDDMSPIYALGRDVILLEAGYAHRHVDRNLYKGIYIGGENWLLNQGIPAYRLMTDGFEPDVVLMERAISKAAAL